MPISIPADEPANTPFTLEVAVRIALSDNAELRSLRARLDAMNERPTQAGALPNPAFTYSGMDATSGGNWPNTAEKRYSLEQELPWFGKRSLRQGMAVKDSETARRELDTAILETALKVKENYFDLCAVQQVTEINRGEEAVLRGMADIAATMYAAGSRTQSDVLKAQAEATLLKQKQLDLATQETVLKAKLNTLFNRAAESPLGTTAIPSKTNLTDSADNLADMARVSRPELKAAQAQIERYELEGRLMAREALPDYRVGLEYRDTGTGEDMAMVSLGVQLPLWRSKYRAGVREAEKMRAANVAAREATERQILLQVQEARAGLQAATRSLELYRNELIPQATARYRASETAYRTGSVDFVDLLESERFLLDAKRMAAMAEAAAGTQAARLERAIGLDPLSAGGGSE
jgi:outer membrane protein, heavy metal efflux system